MTPIAAGIAFVIVYAASATICGALVKRLVAPTQEYAGAACFLIGTAFAPFALGVLYGSLLIVAPGLPRPGHAVLEVAACAAVLALVWRAAVRDLNWTAHMLWKLAGRRGPYWRLVAVGVVGGTFVLVMIYGFDSALTPVRHHDATVYALDARRVVESGRIGALMTHVPDTTNQIANHNHGSSYQLYLAAALTFSHDPRQDFPLRIAQEMLPVHLVLAVAALALLIRPMAAVFAPVLLLYVNSYVYMISTASRDSYRLLAMVIVAALVAVPGALLRRAGLLVGLLAFAFLWNAHTSALLFAPTLAGVAIVVTGSWRVRFAIAGACMVGFLAGGIRLTTAYARGGDVTAGSFDYYHFLSGTPLLNQILGARGAPPEGLPGVVRRLNMHFREDGRTLVAATAIGLLLVAFAIARGAPVPPLVQIAALFIVIVELQIAGAFDWADHRISTLLAINPRYRLTLYPFVAVLLGWVAARAVPRVPRGILRAAPLGLVLLLGLGTWNTLRHWGFQPLPYFIDAVAGDEFLASHDVSFSFLRVFRTIPQQDLILMDPAYYGWYHSQNRIIGLFDPRIHAALAARDSAAALTVLDKVGVTFVMLPEYDLRVLRSAPLGQALASHAFIPVAQPEFWHIYRRADRYRANSEVQ